MFRLLIVFAIFLVQATSALAYQRGDWVLGQWKGGAYFYPGVVASQNGNMITIQYDDGDVDTRPENQVKPYNWRRGTRVECNFQGAGTWYPGKIDRMSGNTNLTINYDDGYVENTVTARCRSL